MRAPIQAMLWELWRTSRFGFLIRLGATCTMVLVIGLLARGLDAPAVQVIGGVAVMLLMITGFFSESWLNEFDNKASGFSFRLGFVRPVPTWLLVAVPLSYTIATSVAGYLISAAIAGYGLNMSLPLFGPSVLIAFVVVLAVSVIWSSTSRLQKMIRLMLLAAVLVGLAIMAVSVKDTPGPILLWLGRPEYFSFTWQHYAVMFMTMAAAMLVTFVAVDRQRHGDQPMLAIRILRPRVSGTSAAISAATIRCPFRGPLTAQCWYEWQQFGLKVLISGAVIAVLVAGFLTIGGWFYPHRNPNIEVWLGALAISPLFFQLIGAAGAVDLQHSQGTARLSLFDATRSLGDDQFIVVKLLVIAASSLMGWLCLALTASVHMACFGNWAEWQGILEELGPLAASRPSSWWFLASANLVLLFFASSLCLLAVGLWIAVYPGRFAWALIVFAAHVCLLILGKKYDWPLDAALSYYGYLLAGLVACVCFVAIGKALATKSLGSGYFLTSLAFWGLYVGSTITIYRHVATYVPFDVPPAAMALGGVLIFLSPLATTSIAPLAFASHRHR